MEGLDVDTSNDILLKKLKDFKRVIIKSINKFNSYIKLDTKKKRCWKERCQKERYPKGISRKGKC